MENVNKLRQKNKNFHFTILPSAIFSNGLDYGAIAVYCYLASHSETFNPSINKIAADLNMSKNKTIKSLRLLCSLNIISLIFKGNSKVVSRYGFTAPHLWNVSNKMLLSKKNKADKNEPSSMTNSVSLEQLSNSGPNDSVNNIDE